MSTFTPSLRIVVLLFKVWLHSLSQAPLFISSLTKNDYHSFVYFGFLLISTKFSKLQMVYSLSVAKKI